MSTHSSPANSGYFLDEDETVDELMDALSGTADAAGGYPGNETIVEAAETDSERRFEELIAHEILFPEETDDSGQDPKR